MRYTIADSEQNTVLFDSTTIREFLDWFENTPSGELWTQKYGRGARARLELKLSRLENTTFVKGGDDFKFEKYEFYFKI